MGGCTAINCRNHSRKGHRMFQFPKDAERKKKWLINMGRVSWIPGKTSQLCSEHFEDSEFEQNRADGWKKLKQTAVPTKFDIPNAPVKMTTKRVKEFGFPTKPGSILDVHLQDVHQNDVQKECQGAEIAALKKKLVDMEAKLKMIRNKHLAAFIKIAVLYILLYIYIYLCTAEPYVNNGNLKTSLGKGLHYVLHSIQYEFGKFIWINFSTTRNLKNNAEKEGLFRRVLSLEQDLAKKEAHLNLNITEKADLVRRVTTLEQELGKKEAKLKFNYTEKEDLVKQVTTLKQELVKKDAKLKLMTQLLNSDGSSLCSDVSISDVSSSDDAMDDESNNDALHINSLPDEIMVKIFHHLTQNELGQIARVCKRWNMLTKSAVLWKEVDVVFYKRHECQTTLAKAFVNLLPPCVTFLGINFFHYNNQTGRLNFEELSVTLQERCPLLKTLMFQIALLSDYLPSVIDLCTRILPNLQVLGFFETKFSDCPERDECSSTSKIEVSDISYCHFGDINKCPISKMLNLKKLILFDTSIDDGWFEGDTSFLTQLNMLNLGFSRIGSNVFKKIRNHALNLEELYLCETLVNDKDFNFNNSVFPHLKTICLKRCSRVTCKGVVFLIQWCKSLENVYVNEDVAESYAKHSFVIVNKCKSGIVKSDGNCYLCHNVD